VDQGKKWSGSLEEVDSPNPWMQIMMTVQQEDDNLGILKKSTGQQ
jgi:hypothetical protein